MVGADAKEVERGLKSDGRIGSRAYLGPGAAFAGGTLARDVRFLSALGPQGALATPLIDGVLTSNELHTRWMRDKVQELLLDISAPVATVLGLTYKPGTSTLRRSAAVELCAWLAMRRPRIVDEAWFVADRLAGDRRITYIAPGRMPDS